MYIKPFIQLVRPANTITAISDVIAGIAISGYVTFSGYSTINIILLIISTSCLYGSGIAFNDVFDYEEDKKERPNRPIPNGSIQKINAGIFASILLFLGIISAYLNGFQSGNIALLIGLFSFLYNRITKHISLVGALNMGVCRSLNLVLGMSIINLNELSNEFVLCIIPLLFIMGVTLTSQKETTGNNKTSLKIALINDSLIVIIILFISSNLGKLSWEFIPFLILWFGMNSFAKVKAIYLNTPSRIKNAVKMGILSLIPLNTIYTAIFLGWKTGLLLMGLLPFSIYLSRRVSVT